MAKLAKGTAKSAKTKLSESKAVPAAENHSAKKTEKVKASASQAEAKTTSKAAAASATDSAKKVSQKLIETIEKRKKAKGMFGKPPGRRGRRPKNAAEYTPSNQEEDGYVLEQDMEGIEYDTGIRMKDAQDDNAFNLDRFDDYEVEELNFD